MSAISRYLVAKFGGTSVATVAGWNTIHEVIREHREGGRRSIIVCSAVAGVTNHLVTAADRVAAGEDASAAQAAIHAKHQELAVAMGVDVQMLAPLEKGLAELCRPTQTFTPAMRAEILAHGELMSTALGTAYLARRGVAAVRLDARTLLRSVDDSTRAEAYLSATCAIGRGDLASALDTIDANVIVTQGFIASNAAGETVVLGRGGSDTSGAYFAAGAAAEALEIWTDVPGMFTADPRRIGDARLLRRLSYREAEAAGSLGAKVLHPRTIEPMRVAGIPIRIRWTAHPEVEGTVISRRHSPRDAKAIVSRRDLALVTMWRPPSWQPVGFMAEVAERFRALGLSMDLISSSPSEIRVTIDVSAFPTARDDLARLCAELQDVCRPRVLSTVSCVSIVGTQIGERVLRFAPIGNTAVHLVTHSPRGDHVSFVVDPHAEAELVAAAHAELIAATTDESTFGDTWTALMARTTNTRVDASARAEGMSA